MNEASQTRQALRTSAYEEALAELFHMNVTDLRALESVVAEPGITPGRLAELTGLTSGAVTGVLDRLEDAGFVERRSDPDDRRSVRIHPSPEKAAELAVAFEPLEKAIAALLERQTSEQREALQGFLAAALDSIAAETARLRARSRGGFVGETYTAPVSEAVRGRLVFASDAVQLDIVAGAPEGELVNGTFRGSQPDVRSSGGVVTVRYPREGRGETGTRVARLALNTSIPWTIELDGDIASVNASLDGISLERFEIGGDVANLSVALPTPVGTVPVRVNGDVAAARFDRPGAIPVSLRVNGDALHVKLDDQRRNFVSDPVRLESDGYATTPDRYEIELRGDAAALRVTRR
jgi:DNA-binding MarR family transcriptional regulator